MLAGDTVLPVETGRSGSALRWRATNMIDPRREPPIRLADVPKLGWLPRRSGRRRLHVSTLYRWEQRGVRGVRLETIQCGGTRCTTEAALVRFFQAIGQADFNVESTMTAVAHIGPAHARAERLLDQAGIR